MRAVQNPIASEATLRFESQSSLQACHWLAWCRMAPKKGCGKAGAAAKKRAAGKAVGTPCKKAAKRPPDFDLQVDADEAEEGEPPTKRSFAGRRALEMQVHRIIERKLKHLSADTIKTTTSKSGEHIFDYILRHVRDRKVTNGRLSSNFWCKFWKEFKVHSDITEDLPAPRTSETDHIPEELIEAIDLARAENPADCSPAALIKYLGSAPLMSETAMYGLFCSIQVGPTMLKVHVDKIYVAVLAYWARSTEAQGRDPLTLP